MEMPEDRYQFDRPAQDGEMIDELAAHFDRKNMDPEDVLLEWVEKNVWARGLTVDQASGEVVDPETGETVGMVPRQLLAALETIAPEDLQAEPEPAAMPVGAETGTIPPSSLSPR